MCDAAWLVLAPERLCGSSIYLGRILGRYNKTIVFDLCLLPFMQLPISASGSHQSVRVVSCEQMCAGAFKVREHIDTFRSIKFEGFLFRKTVGSQMFQRLNT